MTFFAFEIQVICNYTLISVDHQYKGKTPNITYQV